MVEYRFMPGQPDAPDGAYGAVLDLFGLSIEELARGEGQEQDEQGIAHADRPDRCIHIRSV